MTEVDKLEFLTEGASKAKHGLRSGRLSLSSLLLLLGVIAVAAVLALQLARQNARQPTSGSAPDFQLKTFQGDDLRLSDYRGQVVLINFWASWCPPCRDEAPDLQAIYSDFRDSGLVVIGVNILDSSRDNALGFLEEYGISYPNGEDTGQYIANHYHVEAPPESFLIDRSGNIHRFVLGALRYDDLSESIQGLLAG